MSKIVVALGGNALGHTPEAQLEAVKTAAKFIVDLAESGNELVLVHGNGPQVGMIKLAFDSACKIEEKVAHMALKECGAMSQGYIGYHLQQAVTNECLSRNINKHVTTIVTQVEVDEADPAFANPTKPVGNFYTQVEAEELMTKGMVFVEDAGRGYRQVVASPLPQAIVELETIQLLMRNGNIVIAAGGGGVPVVKKNSAYSGIDAVIDKDFSAAQLAQELDADKLLILTAVEHVSLHYKQSNQTDLHEVSISALEKYMAEGHFSKGSMLPKVQACLHFVKKKNNREAIIGSLFAAKEALEHLSGTCISSDLQD